MMPCAWPLFLLLLQAPAAADQPIRNFLKVSPEFCTGGQPRPEHFARLKADAVRVGAFFLVRRVVRDGWSWDASLAEARKIGLVHAPHLEEFAKRYVDSHPKK